MLKKMPSDLLWEVALLTCGSSFGRAGNRVVGEFREHPTTHTTTTGCSWNSGSSVLRTCSRTRNTSGPGGIGRGGLDYCDG